MQISLPGDRGEDLSGSVNWMLTSIDDSKHWLCSLPPSNRDGETMAHQRIDMKAGFDTQSPVPDFLQVLALRPASVEINLFRARLCHLLIWKLIPTGGAALVPCSFMAKLSLNLIFGKSPFITFRKRNLQFIQQAPGRSHRLCVGHHLGKNLFVPSARTGNKEVKNL